jgi:hypothetical protein
MKLEECKGCVSYYNRIALGDLDYCSAYDFQIIHIPSCPCVNCMVKPICNKVCNTLRIDRRNYLTYEKFNRWIKNEPPTMY